MSHLFVGVVVSVDVVVTVLILASFVAIRLVNIKLLWSSLHRANDKSAKLHELMKHNTKRETALEWKGKNASCNMHTTRLPTRLSLFFPLTYART